MTVRLTPTESETPPPQNAPDPPEPSEPSADRGSRPALREARRQRRRTAWLCAAVVALCLGLTIVTVTLARYRPLTPSAALPTAVVPRVVAGPPHPVPPDAPAAPVADRTVSAPVPFRGAPAPEGGNP